MKVVLFPLRAVSRRGFIAGRETRMASDQVKRQLASNLAEAWHYGGWVKNFLGEPEPAIERFARAMRLIRGR
ncbi:hypothetical protein Q2941_29715 [Bradyrhizobium sp. UFLA05-153]